MGINKVPNHSFKAILIAHGNIDSSGQVLFHGYNGVVLFLAKVIDGHHKMIIFNEFQLYDYGLDIQMCT